MFSEIDRDLMGEALVLAQRGLYTTDPNPRVGCVVALGPAIIGRGFHAFAGGPHAEVAALADAGPQARGGTAYVTLEPCCHQGRTGPCTEALIAAGIKRVVYAHEDPNPQVAGAGHKLLERAGIQVQAGLLRDAARGLNPGYLSRIERGRPHVRCKIAMSLDGRTALSSGESQWISGEAARQDVHQWRARSSAILTGIGTVLQDDPHLDARLHVPAIEVRQPARVILDSELRTPAHARLFNCGGPVHIFVAPEVAHEAAQASVHEVPRTVEGLQLEDVMTALARLEFNEVLVEAGALLNGSLLKAGLVDELIIYMAPHLLGEGARGPADIGILEKMSQRPEFTILEVLQIGADLRLRLRPGKGQADHVSHSAARRVTR